MHAHRCIYSTALFSPVALAQEVRVDDKDWVHVLGCACIEEGRIVVEPQTLQVCRWGMSGSRSPTASDTVLRRLAFLNHMIDAIAAIATHGFRPGHPKIRRSMNVDKNGGRRFALAFPPASPNLRPSKITMAFCWPSVVEGSASSE